MKTIAISEMTDWQKEIAIYSMRYLFEDLNEYGWERIAEITGLPMGVVAEARYNLFCGGKTILNMKTQIRRNTFETNSSSSHSITINNKGGLHSYDIPITEYFFDEKNNSEHKNCIILHGGEYGWGEDTFSSAMEKANYVAQEIEHTDNEELKAWFEEVLKEETGAEEIVYNLGDGYIDHQSVGTVYDSISSKEELKNFIFCRSSVLVIDNDNH